MPAPRTAVLPDAPAVGVIQEPMYGRRKTRGCTRSVLAVLAAASVVLGATTLHADEKVVVVVKKGDGIQEKSATLTPLVLKNKNAKGTAKARFNPFHPAETQEQDFVVNPKTEVVNPNPFTLNYSGSENHGSTGSATFNMGVGAVMIDGKKRFTATATVDGKITPGRAENLTLRIKADLKDPFVFSDSDADAHFNFVPEGLDYSFSLLEGTAFPDVFSSGPDMFGAVADETSMAFRARIAPGAVPEPDDFFDGALQGAVDLYDLVITSDMDHNISAELSFASSTAEFALDFRDGFGMPFDPSDPIAVDLIEEAIAEAFSDGMIMADMTDVFTIGFTPSQLTSQLSKYTYGTTMTTVLTAVEAPEPATLALLGLGAVPMLLRRRR